MKGDCEPQRRSAAWPVVVPLALLLAGFFPAAPAKAQTLGMVMDDATNSAIVFNADTDTVLGVVPIPGGIIGDCSITRDQTLGFATNLANQVIPIELVSLSLAGPPIPISNFGQDTSISPDGKFLVVSNSSFSQPLSVIDIATQVEIGTPDLTGSDHNSVEVCENGSVLATSINTDTLRRGTIDGAGTITNTGEVLAVPNPMNAYCAPGAQAGVAVSFSPITIRSFTIPGLGLVDTRLLSTNGLAAVFNPAGDRVYVRTTATVDVFTFDPTTGALGVAPLFVIPGVPSGPPFFGMDQIGIHPNGTKLYVPTTAGGGGLRVFDPADGSPITTITDPAIVGPTGVCFPPLPLFDHFLCYKTGETDDDEDEIEVLLSDQFEVDELFEVEEPRFLCNPADKNGEGIADEETHLVGYKIERENDDDDDDNGFIQKNIQVDNQFGTIFVDVKRPDRLLVPSSKDLGELLDPPDPEAHNVDHFKCYKVRKTPGTPKFPKGITVTVDDQFDDTLKEFKVIRPRRLCTPVDKNSEGIKNPDNHLMCYKVRKAVGEPRHQRVKGIFINNQFGPERLDTKRARELCVPSEKTLLD